MNAIGRVRDAQTIVKELLQLLQEGEVGLTAVDRQQLTTHLQQCMAQPIEDIETNAQARAWSDAYIGAVHAVPTLAEQFIKPTFTLRTQQEPMLAPEWQMEAERLTQLAQQLLRQLAS